MSRLCPRFSFWKVKEYDKGKAVKTVWPKHKTGWSKIESVEEHVSEFDLTLAKKVWKRENAPGWDITTHSRSHCYVCGKQIQKNALRFRVPLGSKSRVYLCECVMKKYTALIARIEKHLKKEKLKTIPRRMIRVDE